MATDPTAVVPNPIVDDNRANELSSWSSHLLEYTARDPSIKDDWTPPEWRALVGGTRTGTMGRTDPNLAAETRTTTIARGDLFRLGWRVGVDGSENPESGKGARRLNGRQPNPTRARVHRPLRFTVGEAAPTGKELSHPRSHSVAIY